MSVRPLLWTVLLAVACDVAAVPNTHVVHESREQAPPQWIKGSRVNGKSILPLRVGLTQSNLDLGAEWLMDVSDPTSPNYRKHWTSEQVIEAFKPSAESTEAVIKWLQEAGIKDVTLSDNKGWLAADIPAFLVESLLYAEYHEYTDSVTGDILPSTDYYHVPAAIQQHIDYVQPGLKLLGRNSVSSRTLRKRSSRKHSHHGGGLDPQANAGLSNCDSVITPECIAALYQIPKASCEPNENNSFGLYESTDHVWDPVDLSLFFENFTNSSIPANTLPINLSIDGGESEAPDSQSVNKTTSGEIVLDLDVSFPIVYPQTISIWDEDDMYYQTVDSSNLTTSFGFNQLLDSMDGSYCTYSAYNETGDDPNLDPTYPDSAPGGYKGKLECGVFMPPMRRQCNEFMKLGLQGTTFLWASSDSGVGDYPFLEGTTTGCIGEASNYTVFNPGWPNSCPWLTNVGATEVFPGMTVNEPESAAAMLSSQGQLYDFYSGGGFSNVYPIPSYQQSAVAKYFADYNPPYQYYRAIAPNIPNPALINATQLQGTNYQALYNRIGRGYPDVSANGQNAAVVIGGEFFTEGGTSQAAPIFGAIINRLVEERLAANKSSLGFLNPALYQNPQILNDITNGSNPGCYADGFQAAPGWDPVTGLGTPNYPKMLEFFMSLP